MNNKVAVFLTIVLAMLVSCSPEDEPQNIITAEIAYVHKNGFAVSTGECINPDEEYAIAITAKFSKKRGSDKPVAVRYTLNGVEHVMTFEQDGTQLLGVELINGVNQAQIVGTDYKAQVSFFSHDDFELVR
ncbi:hypothetical protein [Flavobacterium hydrophilum]|uniref:Uncharacterized protein n=1 Tax=Flavobacterium hydrophilum TaxID=2211445 RepID=A0A2V4C7W4_9FLAO|nr:hypothetical protein [Flavobacterium hydrophilum]PXY46030.1 hypothetical protein DMB68_02250 [Flavobacterium hydrophilum]